MGVGSVSQTQFAVRSSSPNRSAASYLIPQPWASAVRILCVRPVERGCEDVFGFWVLGFGWCYRVDGWEFAWLDAMHTTVAISSSAHRMLNACEGWVVLVVILHLFTYHSSHPRAAV